MAAIEAWKEIIWLKRYLRVLGFPHQEDIVYCDSQSVKDLIKNFMYHSFTKHIDIHYHQLREAIEGRKLNLSKVNTNDNLAEKLNKVATQEKHKLCVDIDGLRIVKWRPEGEIC